MGFLRRRKAPNIDLWRVVYESMEHEFLQIFCSSEEKTTRIKKDLAKVYGHNRVRKIERVEVPIRQVELIDWLNRYSKKYNP